MYVRLAGYSQPRPIETGLGLLAHVEIYFWIAGCAVLRNWRAELQAIIQLDDQEIVGRHQVATDIKR